MEVIAENLANSESSASAAGRPYRRKLVLLEPVEARTFSAILLGADTPDAGVRVSAIVESPEPPRRVYRPDHPHAGSDGFVSLPNVNPLKEMVDMILTTRAYEANATAFEAAKNMGTRLLELLR
jgi:flagellar basal-body rod protein FlgC